MDSSRQSDQSIPKVMTQRHPHLLSEGRGSGGFISHWHALPWSQKSQPLKTSNNVITKEKRGQKCCWILDKLCEWKHRSKVLLDKLRKCLHKWLHTIYMLLKGCKEMSRYYIYVTYWPLHAQFLLCGIATVIKKIYGLFIAYLIHDMQQRKVKKLKVPLFFRCISQWRSESGKL